jgi:hypothetical protein
VQTEGQPEGTYKVTRDSWHERVSEATPLISKLNGAFEGDAAGQTADEEQRDETDR